MLLLLLHRHDAARLLRLRDGRVGRGGGTVRPVLSNAHDGVVDAVAARVHAADLDGHDAALAVDGVVHVEAGQELRGGDAAVPNEDEGVGTLARAGVVALGEVVLHVERRRAQLDEVELPGVGALRIDKGHDGVGLRRGGHRGQVEAVVGVPAELPVAGGVVAG